MEKLKALWRANTDSVESVKKNVIYFVSLVVLYNVFGFLLTLVAVAMVAFLFPIYIRIAENAEALHVRQEALNAIKSLEASLEIKRSWSNLASDVAAQSADRYSYANGRARKIHEELELRVRHLDRCHAAGIAPEHGASWTDLQRIAQRMNELLDSAAYCCVQGLGGVNKNLLDPEWRLEEVIHTGDPALDVPEEKVVLDMSDYFRLRLKRRPLVPDRIVAGDFQLYDFAAETAEAERQTSNSRG